MALSFYDQAANTSNISNSVQNFLGIEVHHHGQNRMTTAQIKTFEDTFKQLHSDYPEVFGNELKQIHLIHDSYSMPQGRSALSHSVFDRFRNAKSFNETALTVPNIPGVVPGSIALHMPNIQMNQLVGTQSGHTVTGLRGDVLEDSINHEFGHSVHNFLVSPGEKTLKSIPDNLQRVKTVNRQMDNSLAVVEEDARKFGISPESIGSRYSKKSTQEFFAEIFARSRSGTGPGFTQARKMETKILNPVSKARAVELGLSRKEKMATVKMLSATESAIGALKRMRK
jgi:hypothetical protein